MKMFLLTFLMCLAGTQNEKCFDGEDLSGMVVNGKSGYYSTFEKCKDRAAEAKIIYVKYAESIGMSVSKFEFRCTEVNIYGGPEQKI